MVTDLLKFNFVFDKLDKVTTTVDWIISSAEENAKQRLLIIDV